MRATVLLTLASVCFTSLASAWSPADHEIFDLQSKVVTSEGADSTFYTFVGVPPTASLDEINKSYRKRSRDLHPDKARATYLRTHSKPGESPKKDAKSKPVVKKRPSERELNKVYAEAEERYKLLSVAVSVLRSEGKDRYDFFLRNGFPKWKGTGYYYARFRPGLFSVLLGLFVMIGGAAHYGILYLNWRRQREFVDRYIKHARRMAWGDDSGVRGIPGVDAAGSDTTGYEQTNGSSAPTAGENGEAMTWNRKQKRAQEKEARKAAKNPKPSKAAAVVEKARTSGISTPQEAEITSGPQGAKKRVVAENGKVLIVDSVGNVYLEEESDESGNKQEFLLDPDEIPAPTFTDTILFKLPVQAYNASIGRYLGKKADGQLYMDESELNQDGTANGEVDEDEAILQDAIAVNQASDAKLRRKAKRRGGGAVNAL